MHGVGRGLSPYFTSFHGYPVLCHAHISKAGGSSINLIFDAQNRTIVAPEGCARKLLDHEWCQLPSASRRAAVHLVMLRSPRAHVLSQYMECAYSKWGREVVSRSPQHREFPRRSSGQPTPAELATDVDIWVRHFAPAWTPNNGNFGCYTPRDFEARCKPWRGSTPFARLSHCDVCPPGFRSVAHAIAPVSEQI